MRGSVLQCDQVPRRRSAWQYDAVCGSVLQGAVFCCSVKNASSLTTVCSSELQWVAVSCIELCVAVCCGVLQRVAVCCSVLWCVAVCCGVLQCVAVCCSVLRRVAVCCGVLHASSLTTVCCSELRVAACCSVLQRVACCSVLRVAV